MWCWCFLFDQHESCRTQKCRCGMCVVRKLVIGLTGRFKISPSTSRQFGSRAYNLPRNLYKCLFHLYPFPHTLRYLQMPDRVRTHFANYLLIYFCISTTANYASPLGAPVPQVRPSMTAQKVNLLCITLRARSDFSWLLPSTHMLKKASGGLSRVCFESSPMSDSGKFPPNLQVPPWKRSTHRCLRGRRGKGNYIWEWCRLGENRATHGNQSHLTATPSLWRRERRNKMYLPQSRISSYELYTMDFPVKSKCLGPPDTAALVPTEGNNVMMAGVSNVLLARTHTRVSLTQDVQVPPKQVRETRLYLQYLQSAWSWLPSVVGRDSRSGRAATCGGEWGWESVWWGQGELKIPWDEILGSKERK